MDYAVKEMKTLNPQSYAIEKSILALGNSTWNNFLSKLCGDFLYKVCENQTPPTLSIRRLSYLTTPVFEDEKKVRASTKTQGSN